MGVQFLLLLLMAGHVNVLWSILLLSAGGFNPLAQVTAVPAFSARLNRALYRHRRETICFTALFKLELQILLGSVVYIRKYQFMNVFRNPPTQEY